MILYGMSILLSINIAALILDNPSEFNIYFNPTPFPIAANNALSKCDSLGYQNVQFKDITDSTAKAVCINE